LFISFEGIDGCGKSTQISLLASALREKEIPLVVTREPGGTETGQTIRNILLNPDNTSIMPLTELFLYEADRIQHVVEVVKPALDSGKWIICDRYVDATTVYQGIFLEQHIQLIEQLNNIASLGFLPDITFLLDCPAETGQERVHKRTKNNNGKDRFERKALDFHYKVRTGYITLANKYKKRFQIIDSTLNRDIVAQNIWKKIVPYLSVR